VLRTPATFGRGLGGSGLWGGGVRAIRFELATRFPGGFGGVDAAVEQRADGGAGDEVEVDQTTTLWAGEFRVVAAVCAAELITQLGQEPGLEAIGTRPQDAFAACGHGSGGERGAGDGVVGWGAAHETGGVEVCGGTRLNSPTISGSDPNTTPTQVEAIHEPQGVMDDDDGEAIPVIPDGVGEVGGHHLEPIQSPPS
jgi:hypothetical protein